MVGKIIYLRQHYHFGPAKIAMYLKRYHDMQISPSGVWRILKRLELNRLPASQRHKRHDRRWKRYEKPLPGHRVQLDVKFIATAGRRPPRRKYYQFTAICVPFRACRLRFATISHGTSRSSDLRPPYYRYAERMVRMGSPVRFRRGAPL